MLGELVTAGINFNEFSQLLVIKNPPVLCSTPALFLEFLKHFIYIIFVVKIDLAEVIF